MALPYVVVPRNELSVVFRETGAQKEVAEILEEMRRRKVMAGGSETLMHNLHVVPSAGMQKDCMRVTWGASCIFFALNIFRIEYIVLQVENQRGQR